MNDARQFYATSVLVITRSEPHSVIPDFHPIVVPENVVQEQ